MNLVLILGSEETMRDLLSIVGIIFVGASEEGLPEGQLQWSCYATDQAIDEIEQRGGIVTVVKDKTTLEAEIEELYALIDRSDEPIG